MRGEGEEQRGNGKRNKSEAGSRLEPAERW